MDKSLRIATWNADGLQKHQGELAIFLEAQQIDICLISETHFVRDSYFKIMGYKVYHTVNPKNNGWGGSAVIIKERIDHYPHSKYETDGIQSTTVSINTSFGIINISAVYCPPRYNLKKDNYLAFFNSLGSKFIAGGDFNAKNTFWGSRITSTKGKELKEAAEHLDCSFKSTNGPTYWPTDPNKIPDLIDFFILKNLSVNYCEISGSCDLSSDHSPIILTISHNIIEKQPIPTLANKYTNWVGFRVDLENRTNLSVRLKSQDELESETEKFITDIQQSVWSNTPELKRKTTGLNYPKEIKTLITSKRKARRKWQESRDPVDKKTLNRLTRELKEEIRIIKNESVCTYLEELTNDKNTDYSLWKAVKYLKRSQIHCPPIRKPNGTWARSNKEKADLFADYLEDIFKPFDSTENLDENVVSFETDENFLRPVRPSEIKREIKLLNCKKAPGFDLINGTVLKELPKKGIVKLTHLFNTALRLRYVPSLWKIAEIIMIPKPGKPENERTSYRPISLLPTIGKLFEKIYLKRLKPLIDSKNIIPSHQFGFRTQHSTIDQVHRITNLIEKTLEEKKVCSAVFLDVSAAFDKVWHEGLLIKLKKLLPYQHCELLKSYLSDRYFRIKYENEYSKLKKIDAGVPQGSILGPILYLLYTHDIPVNKETTTATFADDTAILAMADCVEKSTENLQSSINDIDKWTKKWRIKLNELKSVHVNFTNKKIVNVPIFIDNQPIPYANTAKYLGMTLDAKLRWKEHVKKKKDELNIKYRKMYWLLGRNSQLSVSNKLLLYKQILRPIWSYGSQLWGCTKQNNLKIIETFQNKVLRNIVNAPWYSRNDDIHRDLNVDSVSEVIKKIASKHEQRLHDHVNVEAVQLLDNSEIIRRLKRTKPFELVK